MKYCLFYKELVEKIFLKTTFFKFVFFITTIERFLLKFSVIFTTCKQDFKFHPIPNKERNVVSHELLGRILMLHEKHQKTFQ